MIYIDQVTIIHDSNFWNSKINKKFIYHINLLRATFACIWKFRKGKDFKIEGTIKYKI